MRLVLNFDYDEAGFDEALVQQIAPAVDAMLKERPQYRGWFAEMESESASVFETHAQSLVNGWERGIWDAEDVVREIRTALSEEREIRRAEAEERNGGTP